MTTPPLYIAQELLEVLFGLSCIVGGLLVARRSTGAAVGFGLAGLTCLLAEVFFLVLMRATRVAGTSFAAVSMMSTVVTGARNLLFYGALAYAVFALARAPRTAG